jgi:hypothetical protein
MTISVSYKSSKDFNSSSRLTMTILYSDGVSTKNAVGGTLSYLLLMIFVVVSGCRELMYNGSLFS